MGRRALTVAVPWQRSDVVRDERIERREESG